MGLSPIDEELVRTYLDGAGWMQLATMREDQPQLAHLWFARDDQMNIYFSSRNTRQHSENITTNPRVAGGVALPPFSGLGTFAFGLTFEGTVAEVNPSEMDEAYDIYRARWPYARQILTPDKMLTNQIPNRFYRITPTLFRVFDESRFLPDNPKQIVVGDEPA